MSAPPALFSFRRVGALVARYLYLLRGSWTRVVEMIYWPTVQLMLWGFMTKFLVGQSAWVAQAAGVLISAVLLWDVLYRSQLGVSLMFFEEMYARNLGHLFVSPLRPYELVASLLCMSLIRTLISFGGASLLAVFLYHYSIYGLGFPLLAFFFNLVVMGWSIGLMVAALVLRFGLGAESLAWVVIFAVAPFSGIYYPISVFPDWLQRVVFFLPSSHVFEGMRAVLFRQPIPYDLLVNAVALNLVYLAAGAALFLYAFHVARVRGLLLQVGE